MASSASPLQVRTQASSISSGGMCVHTAPWPMSQNLHAGAHEAAFIKPSGDSDTEVSGALWCISGSQTSAAPFLSLDMKSCIAKKKNIPIWKTAFMPGFRIAKVPLGFWGPVPPSSLDTQSSHLFMSSSKYFRPILGLLKSLTAPSLSFLPPNPFHFCLHAITRYAFPKPHFGCKIL